MKILVTGASGLLGSKLVPLLLERGHEVVALYHEHPLRLEHERLRKVRVDISDWVKTQDLILKERPDAIVHAAAYTNVDGCEENREKAWKINVEGTWSVTRAARVVNAYLVYISTDYVFDGEKGMYRETDTPCPVNYYGLTKLVGEAIVKTADILYCIVRPSAIYGVGGSKKSFAEYVVEKLRQGEEVKALVDQYVSPTYNGLLAEAVAEIVELKPLGVLHVAGERMNRYEFALKIAEALDLPKDLIKEARMEDMAAWKAKRPRDTSLDTSKARGLLKTNFYDTSTALAKLREDLREAGIT